MNWPLIQETTNWLIAEAHNKQGNKFGQTVYCKNWHSLASLSQSCNHNSNLVDPYAASDPQSQVWHCISKRHTRHLAVRFLGYNSTSRVIREETGALFVRQSEQGPSLWHSWSWHGECQALNRIKIGNRINKELPQQQLCPHITLLHRPSLKVDKQRLGWDLCYCM